MGTVIPTLESFIFWYNKAAAKECSLDYARQMVGFHKTKWYRLCRDYKDGEDISKYFND